MSISEDPEQMASGEAIWSGSALFASQGKSLVNKTRVMKIFDVVISAVIKWNDSTYILRNYMKSHFNICKKKVVKLEGLPISLKCLLQIKETLEMKCLVIQAKFSLLCQEWNYTLTDYVYVSGHFKFWLSTHN